MGGSVFERMHGEGLRDHRSGDNSVEGHDVEGCSFDSDSCHVRFGDRNLEQGEEVTDPKLDALSQMGKRELVRIMRDINRYLDAYIFLSIRMGAELVRLDPTNSIFSDGTITEGFMKQILSRARISPEQYVATAKRKESSIFARISSFLKGGKP